MQKKCLYDQTFYECKVILWDLHSLTYNPNSREVGMFCKNAIKPRICDLFILLNFYVIDKSTKKIFPKFSPTNVNVFCKYEHILILMAATDS